MTLSMLDPVQAILDRGSVGSVLATVVSTWGSSPRPTGSMMAIGANGDMQGSVSGGCVETAVVGEASNLKPGERKVLSYGIADEMAWEVGLACGGKLDVLIEAVDADFCDTLETLQTLRKAGEAVGLVRDADFSNPQIISGASLTGPKLPVSRSQGFMELEGERKFLQTFLPALRLVIIGGVHLAQALTAQAKLLDIKVVLVDPREHFANAGRFPGVKIVSLWPDEALEALDLNENTAVVALSHDPKLDDPGLIVALKSARQPFYIGALGSRRSHAKRIERLKEQGLQDRDLERISGPVGLDIGAVSPAEIAVSIVAELIQAFRNSGPPA